MNIVTYFYVKFNPNKLWCNGFIPFCTLGKAKGMVITMENKYDVFTNFEHFWKSAKKDSAIVPVHSNLFNTADFMVHPYMSYQEVPISEWNYSLPSELWLQNSLSEVVVGTTNNVYEDYKEDYYNIPKDIPKQFISDLFIESYFEQQVSELFSDKIINEIINSNEKPWEKIHRIFSHPKYGNKLNFKNVSIDLVKEKYQYLIYNHLPMQLVLPSLPFKNPNAFRTNLPPDHVDFGEILFLIKLHLMALAIMQVYPFEVEYVILSDGKPYGKMLNVDNLSIERYVNSLRLYRNKLNFQKTIHIVDLAEVTERCDGFKEMEIGIERDLSNYYFQGKNSEIIERINILARGLRQCFNTQKLLEEYDDNLVWHTLYQDVSDNYLNLEGKELYLYKTIKEESIKVALRYAAFNLAMKKLNVLNSLFPSSIRGTIHPKKGQIAMPFSSNIYPWNGVAVVKHNSTKFQIKELFKIFKNKSYRGIVFYGSTTPAFYELLE